MSIFKTILKKVVLDKEIVEFLEELSKYSPSGAKVVGRGAIICDQNLLRPRKRLKK